MDITNIHISVAVALTSITTGTWLTRLTDAYRMARIHQTVLRTIGALLVFTSWIGLANCAWISQHHGNESVRIKREPAAPPVTKIADVSPTYTLTTPNGTQISWSKPDGMRSGAGTSECDGISSGIAVFGGGSGVHGSF